MFELAEETLHTDYSARLPNSDDMDVVETLRAVAGMGECDRAWAGGATTLLLFRPRRQGLFFALPVFRCLFFHSLGFV